MKPANRTLKIAAAQINPIVGDLAGNRAKILDFYRRARARRPDLVIFPECALPGYPPEDLLLRKSFIDANFRELKALAGGIGDCPVWVGFIHQRPGRVFNAAALILNGKITRIYEKKILPNYGVFDEQRYFSPGQGSGLFKIQGLKLGITICEDLWQDGPGRDLRRQGARLLINLSASPYHAEKLKVRSDLFRAQARKWKLPIIYSNMIGGQDELLFDGRSMAIDSSGKLRGLGASFKEDIMYFELSERSGRLEFSDAPILPSPSAPDTPRDIYESLVLGTRDYVQKNGFGKVLIGLSGGIDSALVACIAADAIGPSRVIGVTMPSRFTSGATYSDALLLARNLGIECKEISIKETHKAFLKALAPHFKGAPGVAEENIQPRIRGTLLMALSNKWGHLVLTTGNKSEISTGYCTLYGDTAGGFAVLKDVPKTWVYQLSRYVNQKRGRSVIPQSTLRRAPTAELRRNQKDQDTLPPYPLLDRIVKDYVENDKGYAELRKAGYSKEVLGKTLRMIDLNEYKRRQSPPGIKITPKAFGRDRRMPITNKFREY